MVAFLLGAILGQERFFARIIPNPTGMNGYEEYVRAAEMVATPEFNSYRMWLTKLGSAPIIQEIEKPFDVDVQDPDLVVRRKWNDRFRVCCNLVSTGNRKQVYEPRQTILPETTFPELTRFKQLAVLEANAAHVAFADGQTGEALVHVEDGFILGEKIAGSILVSRLVGASCESITVAELDDHWAQLSVEDAHELRAFLHSRISGPPILVESIKYEQRATRAAINEFFAKPGDAGKEFHGEDKAESVLTAVSKLSSAEAPGVLADAEAATDKHYESVLNVLNGPESGWLTFKDPSDVDSKQPLSMRLADLVLPSLSQVLVVEVRTRTRMRLAYLTASAVEYRWINGKLPDRIDQFTSKDERVDPSSGKNFVYRRNGSWFQITRESKDALGGVALTSPHGPDPDLIPLRP